jgi:TetR/AcrR family transcriptional repressor of nem operon
MNAPNKRDRLVNAAATLFHRKGMVATSLADIAKEADIPIGNVYYYFKTKEELALSALLLHKDQYIDLFQTLNETIDDPRQRLKKAMDYYEQMSDDFARYGCPVGKIVMDTEIEGGSIAKAASEVLQCFLQWAETQFVELGHDEQARAYAASLMCGVQGAVVLAKAMQDPEIMIQELARLSHFIDQLPNKRIQLGKVSMKFSAA